MKTIFFWWNYFHVQQNENRSVFLHSCCPFTVRLYRLRSIFYEGTLYCILLYGNTPNTFHLIEIIPIQNQELMQLAEMRYDNYPLDLTVYEAFRNIQIHILEGIGNKFPRMRQLLCTLSSVIPNCAKNREHDSFCHRRQTVSICLCSLF